MILDTDQATVDRWLAAGTWVQFAEGECSCCYGAACDPETAIPPADWEADQCERCDGEGIERYPLSSGYADHTCSLCGGTGLRRLPVTVPCPYTDWHHEMSDCAQCSSNLRITVAWATVKWGPWPVVARGKCPAAAHVCIGSGTHPAILVIDPDGHDDEWEYVTLPPDIDPPTLIGQWARGRKIERYLA